MMQPIRMRRLTTIFVISMLLFFLYLLWKQRVHVPCAPASRSNPNLANIWYHCNPIEEDISSHEEGSVPAEQYKLEHVAVIIRHGDRNHLHTIPNHKSLPISCDFSSFPDIENYIPEVKGYTRTMDKNQGHINSIFLPYGLYPHEKLCREGYLTPYGSAQHIRNGANLRRAYLNKWKLINEDYSEQVAMETTLRQRTFQSGLAFLYGFLPEFDLSKISMRHVEANNFCINNTVKNMRCHCKSVSHLSDEMSPTHQQSKFTFKSDHMLKRAYMDFAEVLGISPLELPVPSHLFDVCMVHMCHYLPLPQKEEKCIPSDAFETVVNILNENGRKNSQNPKYQLAALLKMLPFFTRLWSIANAVIEGQDSRKFVLYSGHDTTVEPIATALGIADGAWPMYGTRVVFEFYSSITPELAAPDHFIRVLLNGKDVTNQATFCQTYRFTHEPPFLCPLSHFHSFVKSEGFIKDFGQTSYADACSDSGLFY